MGPWASRSPSPEEDTPVRESRASPGRSSGRAKPAARVSRLESGGNAHVRVAKSPREVQTQHSRAEPCHPGANAQVHVGARARYRAAVEVHDVHEERRSYLEPGQVGPVMRL